MVQVLPATVTGPPIRDGYQRRGGPCLAAAARRRVRRGGAVTVSVCHSDCAGCGPGCSSPVTPTLVDTGGARAAEAGLDLEYSFLVVSFMCVPLIVSVFFWFLLD